MVKVDILGVPFDNLTADAVLQKLLGFLETAENHMVVTPNPEAVMLARRDGEFLALLRAADLVLPDGIGIILAARLLRLPLFERVTGCDITQALLKSAVGRSCYLLGAAPNIAEKAAENLRQEGVTVVGFHDGYFTAASEKEIISEIQALHPDILILGMGMPRQEQWAMRHLADLPCKVTLCVGGTIDILAGNVRRAPVFMRKIGLEWLYRLISQPSRFWRMLDLPRFLWVVLRGR
ncbi:MAG: WecB/TagA/CpsF family glycosyltransferase [Turicibacter sp.]|nr:WecB/TagA/CpsF family glycosyltransferase [Turicibacter sp.]